MLSCGSNTRKFLVPEGRSQRPIGGVVINLGEILAPFVTSHEAHFQKCVFLGKCFHSLEFYRLTTDNRHALLWSANVHNMGPLKFSLQMKKMPHRLRLTVLYQLCFAATWLRFAMKSELRLRCHFDLRLTSTTHLVCFLHKQQTPLPFSLFIILPLSLFLSICLDFYSNVAAPSLAAFLPHLPLSLLSPGRPSRRLPFIIIRGWKCGCKTKRLPRCCSSSGRCTKLKRKPPSFPLSLDITS